MRRHATIGTESLEEVIAETLGGNSKSKNEESLLFAMCDAAEDERARRKGSHQNEEVISTESQGTYVPGLQPIVQIED